MTINQESTMGGQESVALPESAAIPAKKARKLTITEQRQTLLDSADNAISTAKDSLQELFDDLDEKRSNMEEKFSGTERYSRFEEACTAVEDILGTLEGIELGIELP